MPGINSAFTGTFVQVLFHHHHLRPLRHHSYLPLRRLGCLSWQPLRHLHRFTSGTFVRVLFVCVTFVRVLFNHPHHHVLPLCHIRGLLLLHRHHHHLLFLHHYPFWVLSSVQWITGQVESARLDTTL